MAENKIDKEVFDTFFKESYCNLEYENVKADFEAIADRGLEELFIDETDITKVNRKNFIVYLKSEIYCEFESIVEEGFDSLNSEITDAVMDVSSTMDNEDEITGQYWDTCEYLLKDFLRKLYDSKIAPMIADC